MAKDYNMQVINSMSHSKFKSLLESNGGKLANLANQLVMTDGLNSDEQEKSYAEDINQLFTEINAKPSIDEIYPVGSIYLTVDNYGSPAKIFGGTWERLPANYALWTTDTTISNENVVEPNASNASTSRMLYSGLPNITGQIAVGGSTMRSGQQYDRAKGAFRPTGSEISSGESGGGGGKDNGVTFDASRSSARYGKSSIVQPPAYKVHAYKRIS